jgi:hypothetical protein
MAAESRKMKRHGSNALPLLLVHVTLPEYKPSYHSLTEAQRHAEIHQAEKYENSYIPRKVLLFGPGFGSQPAGVAMILPLYVTWSGRRDCFKALPCIFLKKSARCLNFMEGYYPDSIENAVCFPAGDRGI